jgi:hypothetical protein
LPMFFLPYFKGILTPSYITWVREGTYPQSLVSNIEQNGNTLSHWFNWYISYIILWIINL